MCTYLFIKNYGLGERGGGKTVVGSVLLAIRDSEPVMYITEIAPDR